MRIHLEAWPLKDVVSMLFLHRYLNFAQIGGSLGDIDVDWPERVGNLMYYLSLMDFDVDVSSTTAAPFSESSGALAAFHRFCCSYQVSGPDCLLPWTWFHDFYFQMTLPVAVLIINGLHYTIVLVLSRVRLTPESKYSARAFDFLGVPSIQLSSEKRRQEMKALQGDIFTKVISFTNIIYMTLVRYCIGAFVCMDIKDQLAVLRVYPDIECYTPRHQEIMAVAAAGLVVYVLGFPLAVFFSLYRIGSKQHHSTPSRLRKYGVVYDRYEAHAWCYEIMSMVRRGGFGALAPFKNSPRVQCFAGQFILMGQFVVQVKYLPRFLGTHLLLISTQP